jgi:SulP family sulfate permease
MVSALDSGLEDFLEADDDEELEELPPKPTLLEQITDSFRPQNLLSSLVAGSVSGIIGVTAVIAFASLLFTGELSQYGSAAIGFFLFGSIVIAALTSLLSSIPGVIAGIQDSGVAVLGVIGVALSASLPPEASSQQVFITLVAAVMASTILTGVVFLALGFFKLGNLIRFIPYPVIGGFLSGSGLLLVKGAITIMTDAPLVDSLTQLEMWARWLPGLTFAVVLLVMLRRFNHSLIVPGMLVATISIFFLVLWLTGTSVDAATEQGWLLDSIPQGSLWQPVRFADLALVDWKLIVGEVGSLFSVAVVLVIALLLSASGIELEVQQEMDLNRELIVLGAVNVLSGLGASAPGAHYLGSTVLVHHMNARTRLTGVIQACISAVVLFAGASLLTYFPKIMLGGLVMFFGLSFLIRWVIDARTELPAQDYVVVLLILGVIFVFGFLPGVGLGVVMAVILFVVNYSRINVIKHELSGANHRSTVERPRLYRSLLQRKGHWLYMLKLQGFIFFGTANTLFNQFRARILNPELQKPRYFLLDFHLVTGVDSSAMLSFRKMLQLAEQYNVVLIFTALPDTMEAQLERDPFGSLRGERWVAFDDLDHGMEWYEDRVIEDFGSVGLAVRPPTMTRLLQRLLPDQDTVRKMMSYFEQREVAAETVLLSQGDPPNGIYFIEKGQVRVQLELHEERAIRLRTMSSGTAIGELGTYLQIPATASVIAEKPTELFFLSTESLQDMEENSPEISTAFHRFMALTIAERLASAAETMKVVLD